MQGRIQRFWIRGPLYVGHHVCPTKKISGFRWSKNAKITLETISFCQNIFFSIFKVSRFLYAMKTCRWNLINFSKFANPLEFFTTGYFIKPFKMIINQIFFNWSFHSQDLFYLFNESPLKMMTNAFSSSRYLKFCLIFLSSRKTAWLESQS